jgi:virginiamycin B lyase
MRGVGARATIAVMSPTPLLRFIALAALAVVAALAALASPASATQKVTTYKLPEEFALPNDLATGPDGAVWVTDSALGRIWRIGVKGKIRSYDLGVMPTGITTAHGSMWVADSGGDVIHRVETDGTSTSYPLRAGAFPTDIVEGSDGALWFAERRGDAIGRITTDGSITEYPLPTANASATQIVAGADGALYFTEDAGKIGRITTAGAVAEYVMPGPDALPSAIVVAPDGSLYVADGNNETINRMTTAGEFTDAFTLPREHAGVTAMAAGPDGSLYISENSSGVVSRMSYDGTFTKKYRLQGGSPDSLIAGPDGALWIDQGNIGQVARLDIGFDPPVDAHGTTFTARAGREAKQTVATFTDADPNARARDYDVTIGWGDGAKSYGWVRRADDGSFVVRGRHAYAKPGTRRVTVRITDGVGKGIDAKVESAAVVSR